MTLHDRIINIPVVSEKKDNAVKLSMETERAVESRVILAYKLGHRDARHIAAELTVMFPDHANPYPEDGCPRDGSAHEDCPYQRAQDIEAVLEMIRLAEKQSREWSEAVSNDYDHDSPTWANLLTISQAKERREALAALDRIAGKEKP